MYCFDTHAGWSLDVEYGKRYPAARNILKNPYSTSFNLGKFARIFGAVICPIWRISIENRVHNITNGPFQGLLYLVTLSRVE